VARSYAERGEAHGKSVIMPVAVFRTMGLGDLRRVAKNSFEASFLDEGRKRRLLGELEAYFEA
jgi:adenosine deaminase